MSEVKKVKITGILLEQESFTENKNKPHNMEFKKIKILII